MRSKSNRQAADKTNYDSAFSAIKAIAGSLQGISERAIEAYVPTVDQIVNSNCRDIKHIEHTLDGLLGFCGYDPAVEVFRKLCKYYWTIDQAATASYVNAYREMWDSC